MRLTLKNMGVTRHALFPRHLQHLRDLRCPLVSRVQKSFLASIAFSGIPLLDIKSSFPSLNYFGWKAVGTSVRERHIMPYQNVKIQSRDTWNKCDESVFT